MGLSFSSRAWHTLPPRLAEHFRVITFDNPGAGRSSAPARFSVADMADDAAAVLDAAGVDRACVFGISMGGMIAIELSIRHAARVEKLVLGCTHSGYKRSHKPPLSTFVTLGLAMALQKRMSPRRMASVLTSDAHYSRDADGFVAWLKETNASDPVSTMRQLRAIRRHDADDRLSQIKAPVLVISGDRDLLVPVENSRRLAQAIRGARLLEFPGVGHCFPVEREDEVVRELGKFFKSARG